MSFGKALILKTAALKPVETLVRKSFLFKPVVTRFIAGDELKEALASAEVLAQKGLNVSLDFLGENTSSKEEALAACEMYSAIVRGIASSKFKDKINISIKLTQCGLDQGLEFAEKNYRQVLAEALPHNIFVRVDMEASEYTERTLEMLEKVFPDFPNTGTVLQSYLYRGIDDTKRMIKLGCRIRVVKGAYLEPESVAFQDKADVDKKYIEMAKLLMKEGNYPAIATHDEAIINELVAFAIKEGIPKENFEWQMLYGIRRDLQDSLAAKGYPVRIYVPYGDSWYPYFTRRLAERPANMFFILKAMFKK